MKTTLVLMVMLLLASVNSFSQNKDQKWVFGIGSNAIDFYPTSEPESITGNQAGFGSQIFNANDHWNKFGLPKIHVTRHLWKQFSFDAAFNMNKISLVGENEVDDLSYHALDGSIQYRFLKDNTKFSPYIFAGGGYTWIDEKGAGTMNAGIGATYWFTETIGLNGEGMYKHSPDDYPNVLKHFQYSMSVVFSFGNGRGKNCNNGF